jgi:hypothetical protein
MMIRRGNGNLFADVAGTTLQVFTCRRAGTPRRLLFVLQARTTMPTLSQ